MIDAAGLALGAVVFVFGGVVKGTLGVGLPLVAVPLLSLGLPATQSIALVMMPVLASNLWQTFEGGMSRQGLRRFAPLIVTLLLSTLITVPLTLDLPDATLRAILAGVVLMAVVLMALPLDLHVSPEHEPWWSGVVGALSGVLGGVSSLTGPIIITYLMALKLPRDVFVGSISIIYLAAALPLYGSMAAHGKVSGTDALLSLAALVPMALGLHIGRSIRGRLSDRAFRRILFVFLVGVALLLVLR
ncbi:MAG: sulfite exporter TauE/SafE family protein [Burkholderiaceae bacterium]